MARISLRSIYPIEAGSLISLLIFIGLVINAVLHGSDFHVFYKTALRLLDGAAVYVAKDDSDPFKYNPAWAYIFSGFGYLPEKVALSLFTVLQLSCWLYGAKVFADWLRYDLYNHRNLLLMLLLSLNALSAETGFGQINGFLFAGTVTIVKWLEQENAPVRAGLLMSLLISLKLNFALLIFLGIFHNWRFINGLLLGGLLLHSIVAVSESDWTGYASYQAWLNLLFSQSSTQYFTYETQGFYRFFYSLWGTVGAIWGWVAHLLFYLSLGLYIHVKKVSQGQPGALAAYWLAGVFLFSPLAWWYQVLFMFPMAFCVLRCRLNIIEAVVIRLCLLGFALASFSVIGPRSIMEFKIQQGFFFGSLCILVIFLKRLFYNQDFKAPVAMDNSSLLNLNFTRLQMVERRTNF